MVESSDLLEQVWLSPQRAEKCAGLLKLELVWSRWTSNSPLWGVQVEEQHLQKDHRLGGTKVAGPQVPACLKEFCSSHNKYIKGGSQVQEAIR